MADSLGVDDDVVLLSALAVLDDAVDEHLLVAVVALRQENVLRAVGDAAPQGNVARVASHDLDDAAALMGGGGVAHLVDGVHGGVHRRVKANRIVRTGNIQIDGSGNADGVDPQRGELARSSEGTVAADDHDAVDAVLLQTFAPSSCPSGVMNSMHLAV